MDSRLRRRGTLGLVGGGGGTLAAAVAVFLQDANLNDGIHWSLVVLILGLATTSSLPFMFEKRHDREVAAAEVFAYAQSAVDDVEEEDDEHDMAVEQLVSEINAKKAELARLKESVGEAPRGL